MAAAPGGPGLALLLHKGKGKTDMDQHPVPHPRLGQAGEAHLLAHATEIDLSDAPEGIQSRSAQR